jgi:zinc and cadmium transporter
MSTLGWIVASGLVMSAIALIGSVTLVLREATLRRIVLPLVAFAAGSLMGGAFFHMIPAGMIKYGNDETFYLWVLMGFTVFLGLEQVLHWHHCRRAAAPCKQPLTYLILVGDGLHNFIGGLAIAGTFVIDVRLGVTAWLAAAAHEIPQELGDFAVLINGGWSKRGALVCNVASALTFLLGGIVAYVASFSVNVDFLVPFAAGNFLYIGASDLVPEVNKHRDMTVNLVHLGAFVASVALMWMIRVVLSH